MAIKSIDEYLKAKGQKTVSMILADMRRKRKPTSLKELGVNGRDLAQAGLRGKAIGDALVVLLKFGAEEALRAYLLRREKKQDAQAKRTDRTDD